MKQFNGCNHQSHNHEADKSSSALTISKNIYIQCDKVHIFPTFFSPPIQLVLPQASLHTGANKHAPPHVNVNTSVSAANKINHRHTETVGQLLSHSYGIRLALYTSITTKYLICISPLAKDTATGVIRGGGKKNAVPINSSPNM